MWCARAPVTREPRLTHPRAPLHSRLLPAPALPPSPASPAASPQRPQLSPLRLPGRLLCLSRSRAPWEPIAPHAAAPGGGLIRVSRSRRGVSGGCAHLGPWLACGCWWLGVLSKVGGRRGPVGCPAVWLPVACLGLAVWERRVFYRSRGRGGLPAPLTRRACVGEERAGVFALRAAARGGRGPVASVALLTVFLAPPGVPAPVPARGTPRRPCADAICPRRVGVRGRKCLVCAPWCPGSPRSGVSGVGGLCASGAVACDLSFLLREILHAPPASPPAALGGPLGRVSPARAPVLAPSVGPSVRSSPHARTARSPFPRPLSFLHPF